MEQPPPQGDPYTMVPPGQTNPDAWGVVIAWDAYRYFAGQVLPEALIDMQVLQGVPM